MQKQVDAVAIGVIVFGVIAVLALAYFGNGRLPEPLPAPQTVNTGPVEPPTIDTAAVSPDGSGSGGSGAPSGFGRGRGPGPAL